MDKIDFNSKPFNISNPYDQSYFSFIRNLGRFSLFKNHTNLPNNDQFILLANRIIKWAQKHFSKDYEKQVEFVGKTAKTLDWGVCGVVGGMEGVALADRMIHSFKMQKIPILQNIPSFLQVIMTPISIFFLAMAIFHGCVEFLNIRRDRFFLQNIEARKQDPLDTLRWLKCHYFTLKKDEIASIQNYVEKNFFSLSRNEKKERFDALAKETLQVKYESLQRRISPGFAKETIKQLDIISKGLRSIFPQKRAEAKQRAETLIQSLTKQAKIKILIHVLGIVAISCTVISMAVFLIGVAGGPFFAIMGTIAFSITILTIILDKKIIENEKEKFHNRLKKINLPIKESPIPFPLLKEAL